MVQTIEQARQQLQTARSQLQQQLQQIQQARQQVGVTPKAQLLKQTLQQQAQRASEKVARLKQLGASEAAIATEQSKLTGFEGQIQTAEKQLTEELKRQKKRAGLFSEIEAEQAKRLELFQTVTPEEFQRLSQTLETGTLAERRAARERLEKVGFVGEIPEIAAPTIPFLETLEAARAEVPEFVKKAEKEFRAARDGAAVSFDPIIEASTKLNLLFPEIKEGGKVFVAADGTVGEALPFGLTPFGKSAVFFEKRAGRFEVVEDPKTAVKEVGEILFEKLPSAIDTALRKAGIEPETKVTIKPFVFDLPGQLALFSLFSPLTSTAASKSAQAKAKAKQVPVKKTKKANLKDITREFEKDFKVNNIEGIKDKFKSIENAIKGSKTPLEKEIAIKNLESLLKDLDKTGVIRGFAINRQTGSFTVNAFTPARAKVTTEIVIDVREALASIGRLRGVPVTARAVGVLEPEQVGRLPPPSDFVEQQIVNIDKEIERLNQLKTTAQNKIALVSLNNQIKTLQKRRTIVLSLSATGQAFRQRAATGTAIKSAQTTKVATTQALGKKLLAKEKARSAKTGRALKAVKGFRGLPLFRVKGAVKKSMIKLKKTPDGWLPLIKSKGVFRPFSKPFKTKLQAQNYGRWLVDHSTSAQYKVKPLAKPKSLSKRVVPSTSPLKFRGFKRVKGVKVPLKDSGEIEKKGSRIDTVGEVKGLKAAKVVKQRFKQKKTSLEASQSKFGGKVNMKAPPKIKVKK